MFFSIFRGLKNIVVRKYNSKVVGNKSYTRKGERNEGI